MMHLMDKESCEGFSALRCLRSVQVGYQARTINHDFVNHKRDTLPTQMRFSTL